ncbi:MAG: 2-oxoacid:acceptor oxidoreductase family protein [Candidatus Omnitrophica bacterium]|nr:2-oxoacid:acceptor oxidoreductase family protein [Candidatus Omnitrophota bacterium]
MQDKVEIRWHGRGGQGAVTASKILAEAALLSGKFIQAFPEFGPERAGAPVKSFNRISSSPINTHVQISSPDIVLVLDPTLIGMVNVCEGLSKDGILIINTSKSAAEMRKKLGYDTGKVAVVNATDIAIREFKRNIPNTPMIAALVKVSGILKLEDVLEGFRKQYAGKFSPEVVEANLKAMKAAYNEVKTV